MITGTCILKGVGVLLLNAFTVKYNYNIIIIIINIINILSSISTISNRLKYIYIYIHVQVIIPHLKYNQNVYLNLFYLAIQL